MKGSRALEFASPEACEHSKVQQLLGAIWAQNALDREHSFNEPSAYRMGNSRVRAGKKRRNRGNGAREAHRIDKTRPRRAGRYRADRLHFFTAAFSEEDFA